MTARLGDVLYWIGCIVATVIFAFTIYMEIYFWITGQQNADGMMQVELAFVAVAVGVWLVGRACRYVLGGR
jgi:hypothetical protein